MQNPRILRFLIENTEDEKIKKLAKDKLKFTPLTEQEKAMYQGIVNYKNIPGLVVLVKISLRHAEEYIGSRRNIFRS